jgi:hypothetical protein
MSNKPGITNPFDNQALNGVNDFSMMWANKAISNSNNGLR